MSYVKAWGAFQYGEKKPVVSKVLLNTHAINLQTGRTPGQQVPPIAIMLQAEIKPEYVEEFVRVITVDADGSRTEPGCARFDIFRDRENPCKFITYEVFQSDEAMAVHKEMPYVKAWGAFQYGDKKPVIGKVLQ